jgi:hypothetical protein
MSSDIRAALERLVKALNDYDPKWDAFPENALAEALAARPLLEQVARLGDCIGAHTVGQIMAISSRARAWLQENPPGQPVAIEPRSCPTPGACSCVEPAPPDHRGVLPMIVSETGACDEPETERIICASISGGADYINNMPRMLTLEKINSEGSTYQKYIQDPTPPAEWEELRLDGGYESGSMWTGHPLRPAAPPAPEVGEVGELVDELNRIAEDAREAGQDTDAQSLTRAASLLEQQAAPAPPAPEVGELVEWLRANALTVQKASGNPANGAKQRMNRAAAMLQWQESRIAYLRSALRECGSAVGSLIHVNCSDSSLLQVPTEVRLACADKARRAATLLQQQAAPAPEVGEVAVGPTDE